ncbi:protein Wnt-8-like [Eurytemora carolleeae]|jgi:wingless-type MMTV integration site family protein 8|uniref:protein Wnt-8-like n=1 Tax=Eurytemora carolleeae TaxID=1294199 RepID=UPI000C75E5E3|nr:protein Wnt-8-like [Eurytemora carolleeae]|eukprot:XP_023340634.1 protein Wnt-8-like [Eurytemora affinis]
MHSFICILLSLLRSINAFKPALPSTNSIVPSTDLSISQSVAAGSHLAMEQCSKMFRNQVWNCPASMFQPNFGISTRESALIQAILSAGIIHTVSRNCSAGELDGCGCGRNSPVTDESWEWAGCSDNLAFADSVSEKFLPGGSLTQHHNLEAGKVAVRKSMRRVCKCHGVSGSCAVQTCWKSVGDFNSVGRYLRRRHKDAVHVGTGGSGLTTLSDPSLNKIIFSRASRDRRTVPAIKKRKLVFLQPSPNYCIANPALRVPGVKGRVCSVSPESKSKTKDIKKCSDVCTGCGLDARKEVKLVSTSCNCKFEWCCNLKCETCTREQITITCVRKTKKNPINLSNST